MTHRNIKIIFYKGSLRCVQDSCERETNIIGSFGNLLSLTIANRWHTPFWQLFRQVSQIPNPLGNVRSSSNRAIDKLLVYVCVPRFDMVDMVDMESCQAYGHIMVGLAGWMIWLTTLWNAWQIAKGWFATFFAFFCACLLLFVAVAFLLLFVHCWVIPFLAGILAECIACNCLFDGPNNFDWIQLHRLRLPPSLCRGGCSRVVACCWF